VLGAGFGALGGYFLGSSIGAKLDATARQKAQAATEQVLAEPLTREDVKPVAKGKPVAHAKPVAKRKTWVDKQSDTHGNAEVTDISSLPDGGECRTVREVAYIKGQEVTQNSRYCRNKTGQWEARAI
jgi:surface antigen